MAVNKEPANPSKKNTGYTTKVWQTVGILAIFVVGILIVRVAFNVLLMALAGMLIAVCFHGLGDVIQNKTRLSRRFSMLISIAGTFIIVALLTWFIGAKIQSQVSELSNNLPRNINAAKVKLASTPTGKKLVDMSSGVDSQKLMATAESFFSTGFGILGDMYIILFLGIFFTASPSLYKDGMLLLIPNHKRDLGKHILNRISLSLKGWLKGMLLSMLLITILIIIGLSIIGIPAAIVLGFITGITEIVPNFGPLIAMAPGVLLALTISGNKAIIVALLYIVSQTIVANIVTPLIQKKMINLPPALTLISQLIMGTLSGALGIILAIPLLAILIILVDELYVKKMGPETT